MFNIVRLTSVIVAAQCLMACSNTEEPAAETIDQQAHRLAQTSIIVDTHVDVPFRRLRYPADVSQRVESGDFDYPRAVAGGLNAPFMSIYTAAELEAEGGSRELADKLIDLVESYAEQWPDKFAIALSPADVRAHFEDGLISLPMGMENGSPIEGKLLTLKYFYDRGIRYLSFAHSLSNHLSDSSYDEERQWNGLSDLGKQAVAEMNRLGIMIDVSHLSDDAFWQVMELSNAPVIASHSSARHFTPGMERNMSDEMIRALADNGGVIQINFGSFFLTQEAREYSDARWEAGKAYQAEHPEFTDSDLWTSYPAIYAAENGPFPFASMDALLDHFDHAVKIAGIDHVGIGSDFEGVGDSLPDGVKDVSGYPNLVRGLLERGYSEDDVRKILGENLLRVWQEVEDYAATTSSNT
jgi:membrane dipeptidase